MLDNQSRCKLMTGGAWERKGGGSKAGLNSYEFIPSSLVISSFRGIENSQ
jgi:hypothetical protein